MRPRRPLVALVVAVVVGALASGCVHADRSVATGTTTKSSSPAPEPRAAPALSAWSRCGGGLECATLGVPLDWRKPSGSTISLAVGRRRHTGDTPRIGSVLINPGGPGQPGVEFLREFLEADRIPKGLGASFDLVSWDPRGTGRSAGIVCSTDAELSAPELDPTIEVDADVEAIATRADSRLARCRSSAGDRLGLVGTQDTVRDMDALRHALGDPQLTFVGYSYGSILGTQFGRMFPDRVRAMVLDGIAVPGGDPVANTHAQARSFEANFAAFLEDCRNRGKGCTFGAGDPRSAFVALVADLESGRRISASYALSGHNRAGTVGTGELYTAVIVAMYARANWSVLEKGLAEVEGRGTARILLALRDEYAGRQPDGSWNHSADAFAAISCADQEVRPTDADGDDRLRAAWAAELPLLGSVFATSTPGCFGFPTAREPLTEPPAGSVVGLPPILLVAATGDPATPYSQAVEVRRAMPGSVLVTWESADHTAYGRGSECLDGPVTRYLVELTVPGPGLRCHP